MDPPGLVLYLLVWVSSAAWKPRPSEPSGKRSSLGSLSLAHTRTTKQKDITIRNDMKHWPPIDGFETPTREGEGEAEREGRERGARQKEEK